MMLSDSFGRIATDLRVSLTDRCNLRCAYCMPPEGLDWLPTPDQLTDDEVVRLIRIGVELLGIREVRFTGGEPLLRRGLAGIIARTADLRPRPEISLTTNAIGLARTAGVLRAAGLDRINVSLDTLRHETFRKLARRDRLPDVLDGRGGAGRPAPGQGQRRAHAGPERRRGGAAAQVLSRGRLRAAVHRADAAGRPARLETGRDGDGGGDPRRARPRVHPHPRRPAAARIRTSRGVP